MWDDTKSLVGKTITKIEVDGYGVDMWLDDGWKFVYWASDGGYSGWMVCESEEDDE